MFNQQSSFLKNEAPFKGEAAAFKLHTNVLVNSIIISISIIA